jgi:hypothetical protein
MKNFLSFALPFTGSLALSVTQMRPGTLNAWLLCLVPALAAGVAGMAAKGVNKSLDGDQGS